MRDDDFLNDNRRLQPQCEADDSEEAYQNVFAMHDKYKRTDSLGNPFDNNGKRLSGNLHQTDCCVPPEASLR